MPNENQDVTRQIQDTTQRIKENAQQAVDGVTDAGERVGTRIYEVKQRVQNKLQDVNLSEATVPDAFRRVPKLFSPRVHSFLDAATTAYFLVLGIWFAARGKGGPATAAFVNGGMVAGVSMLTDYEGTGEKPISFKLHGTLDAVQAATAALAPVLHGFADEPEAAYFWGQTLNETAVIATTDWDAGMSAGSRRKAA